MRGNNLFALFKTKPKTKYNINRKGKKPRERENKESSSFTDTWIHSKSQKKGGGAGGVNLIMRYTSPAVLSIWFCQLDPVGVSMKKGIIF